MKSTSAPSVGLRCRIISPSGDSCFLLGAFDQYVNLLPARLSRGVKSPLVAPNDLDITVVRENTEGEYSDSGGRVYKGTPYEIAVQESIFTPRGVERIIRYAFEEA
jgi:tartrate dehydrogenase/decarboxylase/D-malate dehydrogenase